MTSHRATISNGKSAHGVCGLLPSSRGLLQLLQLLLLVLPVRGGLLLLPLLLLPNLLLASLELVLLVGRPSAEVPKQRGREEEAPRC